jgi:radical SAM superfamily enzyme YgiQ (UPF0313 family)
MKELRERWGIQEIQFEDDNLTLDREFARGLFRAMIDEKLDMSWSVPNGVALWNLEPDIIDLMAESGCYKVIYAVESGVQRVLDDVIGKPLKLDKVQPLIERARANGLVIQTLFVVGFPRETRAEMVETFRCARRTDSDWTSIFIATPYPGTPLYKEALEKGLLRKGFSFDRLDVRYGVIDHPEISAQKLTAWVAREEAKIRLKKYMKPANFRRAVRRVMDDPNLLVGYIGNVFRQNLSRTHRS